MVLSGKVKLINYLPNGKERIVRLHNDADWLGLEGIVGEGYQHTAVAIDDVEVACVSMRSLLRFEKEHPHEFADILKRGYKRLVQTDKWIAQFSTGEIRARVARLLEYLSTLDHGESSTLVDLLTVQEIADILGVTPESVSRTLAEFKRNNTLVKAGDQADETFEINTKRLRKEAER